MTLGAVSGSTAELAGEEPMTDGALLSCPTGELVIGAESTDSVRLSLVIPTYNETQNLPSLLDRLDGLLEPVLGDAYELLVVDDDSPDRTWELALAERAAHPRVRVIRRQGEKGLSTAVIRGWQAARGEILAVMDADLQHPPEVNVGLYREMEKGADLATGSRHVEGGGVSDWSFARRILSRGAQLLGLLILPGVLGRLSDPMSGFFMVRRSALAGIRLSPIGYKILVEVVARGRIRWIAEVGYVFRERTEGESKVTGKIYVHYLKHLLRLRWDTLPASRVIVDMSLLYLLSDPSMLGFGLTRSKIVAAETAMIGNFLFNDAWTFKDLADKSPGWAPKFRRFLGFQLICTIGLVLNVLLLNLLFNFAGLGRYWANGVAIAIVTLWNYGLNRTLNWAPLRTKPNTDSVRPSQGGQNGKGASR
jgi:dolichol-phosphate mannosyltransferase